MESRSTQETAVPGLRALPLVLLSLVGLAALVGIAGVASWAIAPRFTAPEWHWAESDKTWRPFPVLPYFPLPPRAYHWSTSQDDEHGELERYSTWFKFPRKHRDEFLEDARSALLAQGYELSDLEWGDGFTAKGFRATDSKSVLRLTVKTGRICSAAMDWASTP